MDLSDTLRGNSMKDALRILHSELESTILWYESEQRRQPLRWCCTQLFLHQDNKRTVFHWPSALLILLAVILIFVACAHYPARNTWWAIEAVILLGILVGNIVYLTWDHHLYSSEHLHKAKSVLRLLKECIKDDIWSSQHFLDIHCPLSPCLTIQWTLRDGQVVNLPCGLLVEGDVILLRPGQMVPANARLLTQKDDDECKVPVELKAGDMFNPLPNTDNGKASTTQSTRPLIPKPFLVLETPFVANLRQFLENSLSRPTSILNSELYNVYTSTIEKVGIPILVGCMLLVGALRYGLIGSWQGHWTYMIIMQQVQVVLPLLALVFPILWKLLDAYGLAKIITTHHVTKTPQEHKADFESDTSHSSLLENRVGLEDIWHEFKAVLLGTSNCLPRSVNILHVLGNVTSLCCVDKKGVLSWPNPTAEKVFFLTTQGSGGGGEYSHHSSHTSQDINRDRAGGENGLDTDPLTYQEAGFQVLDLSQEPYNAYRLQFDDPKKKKVPTATLR